MAKVLPPVNVQRAHYEICEEAVRLADQYLMDDPRIPPDFFYRFSGIYRVPGPFKLGLEFRLGVVDQLDENTLEILREIGRKAIRQAIINKGSLFVGLIVGEARNKRNYFDVHFT